MSRTTPRKCQPGSVVADIQYTVVVQMFPTDFQDFVLDHPRHPAVDTVTEDVVELAKRIVDIRDTQVTQLDVVQWQAAKLRVPVGNLSQGKINPKELAFGQILSHGDQVPTCGTAQLEDPRRTGRRRGDAEQDRQRGQVAGVRVTKRAAGIGNCIVLYRCVAARLLDGRIWDSGHRRGRPLVLSPRDPLQPSP
jgi:hypothetical protein